MDVHINIGKYEIRFSAAKKVEPWWNDPHIFQDGVIPTSEWRKYLLGP